MRTTLSLRLLAATVLLALFAAACGGAGSSTSATPPSEAGHSESEDHSEMAAESTPSDDPTAATPAVDTPAATLTRDLTGLLVDHEYLAGMAVLTGVQAGGDTDDLTFKAAAKALDNNSVALSETVGSLYGDEAGQQFLSLWRTHIGFFVDYTLAKAGDDKQAQNEARGNLDGYRADFGAFIEGATEGGLTQDAVAEALQPHVEMTIEAIDAVVTGNGNGFEELREAAGHMPMIATALSGAIVEQQPETFSS